MVWDELVKSLEGELKRDELNVISYSTDASVFRKKPLGVVYPKTKNDLSLLAKFAAENGISLIPRGGGTSLAGQCVGDGLVVDTSRYFSRILEINPEEGWVRLEPGVIRDELNRSLEKHGYFFGPNTSTANRCTIGGMIGNNSCGTTSIKYGTTRDKILELEVVLSDGSTATVGEDVPGGIAVADREDSRLASDIHKSIRELIDDENIRAAALSELPKPEIHRRNTGYALDALINETKKAPEKSLNLGKLIAGSEGTLCLISSVKLRIDKLPPPHAAVVCAHFETVIESMRATVIAMKLAPFACELMDRTILELTKGNPEQAENRFFVEGDPGAIIAIEVRDNSEEGLEKRVEEVISALKEAQMGFAYPVVRGDDIPRVWNLRAAGLGVLSNVPGDAKPVAFVEDTAVALNDLPAYIGEFEELMKSFNQDAIYYAHAGAGELHLRPVLNLKSAEGQKMFREIGEASAALVKKYRGSLSGEHGDGRVRAEFIKDAVGDEMYRAFKRVKQIWDPKNIFNPGKIVDADKMDEDFRYEKNQEPFKYKTAMDFGDENMLQMAERCNGSGDCRKLHTTGATMCPSYQATKDEKDSTRSRANVLREVMTRPENPAYPLDSEIVQESLDLCLSCKACKRECPSSVDMAALKAEASFHHQRRYGVSRSAKFFGEFAPTAQKFHRLAPLVNTALSIPFAARFFKRFYGIAPERNIPKLSVKSGVQRTRRFQHKTKNISDLDFVLYIDEFTQFQDAGLARKSGELLKKLGYKFRVMYFASARAAISKGLLNVAKEQVNGALEKLEPYIAEGIPVVGIEPSGILGFRDDFIRLCSKEHKANCGKLAKTSFTVEEFLFGEIEKGKLSREAFHSDKKELHIHLHCHQKALSHVKYSKLLLSLPENYTVRVIPSGCCGMAGSFGYEAKHYETSQKIGRLVLYPHIEKHRDAVIVASGTSCRNQIADALEKESHHPVEILLKALK